MSHGGRSECPLFKTPTLPARIQRALPPVLYHPEHCMSWRGPLHRGKIPVAYICKKRVYAARLLWERFHQRAIEPYSRLETSCKNRFCVNPHHQRVRAPTTTQRRRVEREQYANIPRVSRETDVESYSATEFSEMTESETEADIDSFAAKD